ncbi:MULTISPECIES: long-chain fatty acid--CoA ligase [Hydrogenophaga]|uniref:Long-chain-fatty-acid--CoA ligase n=1 Tax=Hydrogenophaga intermedia TaxID=65786 RepID=A0A1L1PP78_HYDIT|nr:MULTISPECIES: long-chain fatty acid--CoA ligase [Hydrogenophaga]AOS80916.1 long-chain fatty acid--CoA ligase [Hydrogenophaga sp. PBC]TMU71605.1 AMP-binding protein [Hydrogenophaga intermedia]CDN88707.1 Long-chain-fatty-acid--CoA ligase [Hydrogenophaga intermedia]
MTPTLSDHWPPGLPRGLALPPVNVFHNLAASAERHPDKPFTVYYDTPLSYAQALREAERIAAFLQQRCGVRAGDRVLLCLQNSPQWALAFYGILRANAVVVPVNPMNREEELRHCVDDSGARVAVVAHDLLPFVRPLLAEAGTDDGTGLKHAIVATYSDHLREPTDLRVPDFVRAPREALDHPALTAWADAVAAGLRPGPLSAGPDDLCAMPYTSGTTGLPKGCMHTHRSVMATLVGGVRWFGTTQDAVCLSVLPFFHVTGLSGSLNGPIYAGATLIVLSRWDREAAAICMARYGVTVWQAISTMVIDFLALPALDRFDLSRLSCVRGGGAAMPDALAARLKALTGRDYIEGYGMTETMAATHINPLHRPKRQCLGLPVFEIDARVIDPETLAERPVGETGEIVVHGPQVMQGYWRNPQATAEAFIELDGQRFLRTGDLGHVDAEGYFFMTDRLKRMINASGYKVWPAEVEALMYRHPAIQEACVIGARDPRRGETVKALVVLRPEQRGQVSEQDLIDWAHGQMAAYKSPRIVEFVAALPRSGSGKVMWRELQEQQAARDATNPSPS